MRVIPPAKVDPCLNSPIKAHHWMIDGLNYGVCKYCSKERDFAKLIAQRLNKNPNSNMSH